MNNDTIIESTERLEPKVLWSLQETCYQLGLSRSTVLSLAYGQKLPSVMIGRRRMFLPNQVRDWVSNLSEETPIPLEKKSLLT